MSLIADPDYVIHSLRLAYLRRIDDTAGPRVLTLPTITHLSCSPPAQSGPSSDSITGLRSSIDGVTPIARGGSNGADGGRFASDSHVVIAGLTDARLNPELRALHSPRLSPTKSIAPPPWSGKAVPPLPQSHAGASAAEVARAGAGLRYTHTIYGAGRTGAVGMRVSGRRAPSMDEAVSSTRRRSSAMSKPGVAETEEPLRAALARRSSARVGSISVDAKLGQPSNEEGTTTPQVPALAVQAATGDARAAAPLTAAVTASSPSLLASSSSGSPQLLASSPKLVDSASTPSSSSTGGVSVQRSASITAPPRPPKRVYPAGRWRSASEGAEGAPKVALRETQHVKEEEEAAEEMQSPIVGTESVDELDAGPGMHRTDSDSTVFSLASIPPTRGHPRRSDSGTDSTPLTSTNRHPFTPVTELEEPAFPFPAAILQGAARPAYPRSDSEDSVANRALAPHGPSASEFDSSVDSRAPLSVGSTGGSIDAASALQPHSLSPLVDSEAPGSASLPDTSALEARGAPIPSALGLETDAELVPVSAPNEATSTVAAVTTGLHDPTRHARGRVTALQASDEGGERRLYPSRSRSQLPGSTGSTTHGASNEWFASLKSNPQAIAARHAALPTVSALSVQLNAQSSAPPNPFTQLYAGVGMRSGAASVNVSVFFPFAAQQAKRATPASDALQLDGTARSMRLCVRKDATMEEVVGYALHCYVEEDWTPPLADGYEEEDDAALDVRLSTAGWTLRIVEDGEVDDDYPAIDRSLIVGKFGADELAVVEATPAQVKQHLAAQTPAQRTNARHGSRNETTTVPLPMSTLKPAAALKTSAAGPAGRLQASVNNAPPGSLVSVQGTPIFASSALARSAMGPSSMSIFLRVAVTPNAEVRYKTTLQVPSDMYLADVLETICRKRHLANADEWALIVPDKDIVVPLDRTVESLQGNHDLALVRRSSLGAQGGAGALTGQSTNPSASIFKRLSEPVQPRYNKAKDIASTYKSFTVNRKMPMFVGRHERTLTLDGDWIHIIPTDSRAFQTHAASFPVQSVTTCARSTKLAHNFKLIVNRETERDTKRYDFECATTTQAAEIVREINERMRR